MFVGQVKNSCRIHGYTYSPANTNPQVEYRIHWGEDGDSHDIEFVRGPDWRSVRKLVAKCEAGEDEEQFGLTIQWIERVSRHHDQEGEYMEDDDYDTMWEREVVE